MTGISISKLNRIGIETKSNQKPEDLYSSPFVDELRFCPNSRDGIV